MSLVVTSPAVTLQMTTFSRVCLELGISEGTTAKDILLRYIADMSDHIGAVTGRKFARQTYTEKMATTGRNILMVSETPLVSIASISYGGSTVALTSTQYMVDDYEAGIIYKKDGWYNTQIYRVGVELEPLQLDEAERLWTINYTAGFVLPPQVSSTLSTSSTAAPDGPRLPDALESACVDLVVSKFLRRGTDGRIKSQKIGEAQESYGDNEMSPFASRVLQFYTRAY